MAIIGMVVFWSKAELAQRSGGPSARYAQQPGDPRTVERYWSGCHARAGLRPACEGLRTRASDDGAANRGGG